MFSRSETYIRLAGRIARIEPEQVRLRVQVLHTAPTGYRRVGQAGKRCRIPGFSDSVLGRGSISAASDEPAGSGSSSVAVWKPGVRLVVGDRRCGTADPRHRQTEANSSGLATVLRGIISSRIGEAGPRSRRRAVSHRRKPGREEAGYERAPCSGVCSSRRKGRNVMCGAMHTIPLCSLCAEALFPLLPSIRSVRRVLFLSRSLAPSGPGTRDEEHNRGGLRDLGREARWEPREVGGLSRRRFRPGRRVTGIPTPTPRIREARNFPAPRSEPM